jgi:hypothetical protein
MAKWFPVDALAEQQVFAHLLFLQSLVHPLALEVSLAATVQDVVSLKLCVVTESVIPIEGCFWISKMQLFDWMTLRLFLWTY